MLAGVALRYLQVAYTGMQKSLQQECDFIQRITEGVGKEFQLVEDELCRDLITALFHRMENICLDGMSPKFLSSRLV